MKLALFVLSCTVLAVYAAPSKAKCPLISSPRLNPGCHEVSGTDAAGCPTLEVQCIHVDPPRQEDATFIIAPRVARNSVKNVLADHHRVRRYGVGNTGTGKR